MVRPAPRAFMNTMEKKHKVPLAYSRAEEDARSIHGHRDDELERLRS
jgi:hypothetical protein